MRLTSASRPICTSKPPCSRSKPASMYSSKSPWLSTLPQCDAILDAANRSEKIFMVAQVLRFWPEYCALHKLHQSGGARRYSRSGLLSSLWLARLESLAVGRIPQRRRHHRLAGSRHRSGFGPVWSAGFRRGPQPWSRSTRSMLHCITAMESPCLYRVAGIPPATPFAMGFRVAGDRGGLELKNGVLSAMTHGEWNPVPTPAGDAYLAELSYFIECCQNGSPPGRCLPLESARAVKLALLLKESRSQGGTRLPCTM